MVWLHDHPGISHQLFRQPDRTFCFAVENHPLTDRLADQLLVTIINSVIPESDDAVSTGWPGVDPDILPALRILCNDNMHLKEHPGKAPFVQMGYIEIKPVGMEAGNFLQIVGNRCESGLLPVTHFIGSDIEIGSI